MKAPFASLIIFLAVFAASDARSVKAEMAIYVSPAGSDEWDGNAADPNENHTNGPLRSPEAAMQAVRAMKVRKTPDSGPIHVYIRGGIYYLPKTLRFHSEDSGTTETPIEWSAYQNEHPILSGGMRLTDWTATTVNDKSAWVAKLPEGIAATDVCELWLGDSARESVRLTRARWPKHGTLPVVALGDSIVRKGLVPGSDAFGVAEKDVQHSDKPSDGEVIVTNRWVESHLPIASIDVEHRLMHFRKQSVFGLEIGDRYWIENLKELLTEPGEFFIDVETRSVYLIAPQGVNPNTSAIIVPHLPHVMSLEGDAKSGRYVERITFRNLAFAHSEWSFQRASATITGKESSVETDASRSGFGQAAIGVPGAIRGWGLRDCTFRGCEVSHVGNYGIELAEGCQRNRISRCTFTDLGAGAIKLGDTAVHDDRRQQAGENEVADCTIADGGNLYPSCVAVWMGQSQGNRIVHNDIHGFWYTGISIGWTWGYGKAQSQRNLVEYNHVHHIGKKRDGVDPILSDMGGIYTLGNQEGTVIRNNSFHDIAAVKYGGWGIYFDEGTTDILAENNLVYRTTHGGFHQHYGKGNRFRNNIIAFGRDAQIQRTRPEEHQSFTFENNVVLWDSGQLLAGDWRKLGVAFDHNTYWHVGGGEIRFGSRTWDAWRKAGMDEHSKLADPKFKDAKHADFALTPESAAAVSGFKAFDLSTVGPRK